MRSFICGSVPRTGPGRDLYPRRGATGRGYSTGASELTVHPVGVLSDSDEHDGLEEVRRAPGYHDEPLKGDRAGQRSIRLSRSYRAIYEIKREIVTFASVEEVSTHDY
jgi:plasmid maintenance system killer protein